MPNVKVTDEAWQKIFGFLQEQEGIHLGKEADCRRFDALTVMPHCAYALCYTTVFRGGPLVSPRLEAKLVFRR